MYVDDVRDDQDDLDDLERAEEDLPSDDDLGIGGDEDGVQDGDAEDGDEGEDGEEGEEGDAGTEDEDEPGSGHVPYNRFKSVNDRRKAAEEEAAALRAKLQNLEGGKAEPAAEQDQSDFVAKLKAKSEEIDRLEDELEEARLDADLDKVRELRRQIRAAQDEAADLRVEQREHTRLEKLRLQQAEQRAQAQKLVERSADLIARYPQLADDDAGGDAEARNAVIKIQQRLVKRGTPPIDALEEAAELWAEARGLQAAGRTGKATDKAKTRLEEARRRHADAERRQPPHTPGLGNARERKPAPSGGATYSEKEWEMLSQEERDAELGIA